MCLPPELAGAPDPTRRGFATVRAPCAVALQFAAHAVPLARTVGAGVLRRHGAGGCEEGQKHGLEDGRGDPLPMPVRFAARAMAMARRH